VTRTKIRIRADYLTRSSTSDRILAGFRLLAQEVLGPLNNHDDRILVIATINRLTGYIGDRNNIIRFLRLEFSITSEDLLERILVAASSSNAAQFIEQLNLEATNMVVNASSTSSLASSELSAGGGSGSARVQGTPFGRPSTSSGESASDAAVAITRGPDPYMPRFRVGPGDNTQDANAFNPTLTRPVASMDLAAAGADDADQSQTQAVIDGAVLVTNAAAAAAKSESDDDSAPADSRKGQLDADDHCKPPAKRS
jgi:hypothetical protein